MKQIYIAILALRLVFSKTRTFNKFDGLRQFFQLLLRYPISHLIRREILNYCAVLDAERALA